MRASAVDYPALPDSKHAPGDVLVNKYSLEAPLGEGSQGWVWRASNLALDAKVAIKLVHAEADEGHTLRLLHEARVVARIGHPSIVRVFDVEQTPAGDWFIVMELLEGETLRSRLDREGRLSPRDAIRLLLPIADALSAAHAHGVIHRDVKPDNLFLCASDEACDFVRPKLLDFGTVKESHGRSRGYTTATGLLIGTPGYLAPEQVFGDNVDERADVWGLCITLYECLTGQTPFDGPTVEAVLRAALKDEVISILRHAAGDEELWSILERGLAKDPADRWPSIDSLGQALARWLVSRGTHDDACGVLLENRWLSGRGRGRSQSDPALAAGGESAAALVASERATQRPSAGFSWSGLARSVAPTRRELVFIAGSVAAVTLWMGAHQSPAERSREASLATGAVPAATAVVVTRELPPAPLPDAEPATPPTTLPSVVAAVREAEASPSVARQLPASRALARPAAASRGTAAPRPSARRLRALAAAHDDLVDPY